MDLSLEWETEGDRNKEMFHFTYKDMGHCTILVGTLEKYIAFHWIVHSLLYVLGCWYTWSTVLYPAPFIFRTKDHQHKFIFGCQIEIQISSDYFGGRGRGRCRGSVVSGEYCGEDLCITGHVIWSGHPVYWQSLPTRCMLEINCYLKIYIF